MVKGSIEWEHSHENGLTLHINPGLGRLLFGETRKHMITARKEMLLAFRGALDMAIKHLEDKETKTEQQRTQIKVE